MSVLYGILGDIIGAVNYHRPANTKIIIAKKEEENAGSCKPNRIVSIMIRREGNDEVFVAKRDHFWREEEQPFKSIEELLDECCVVFLQLIVANGFDNFFEKHIEMHKNKNKPDIIIVNR